MHAFIYTISSFAVPSPDFDHHFSCALWHFVNVWWPAIILLKSELYLALHAIFCQHKCFTLCTQAILCDNMRSSFFSCHSQQLGKKQAKLIWLILIIYVWMYHTHVHARTFALVRRQRKEKLLQTTLKFFSCLRMKFVFFALPLNLWHERSKLLKWQRLALKCIAWIIELVNSSFSLISQSKFYGHTHDDKIAWAALMTIEIRYHVWHLLLSYSALFKSRFSLRKTSTPGNSFEASYVY